MGRIKGWVSKKTIHPFCRNHSSMVYMEEIPKNAIRGTVIVEPGKLWHEQLHQLPAELFGNKISIIIIPEED